MSAVVGPLTIIAVTSVALVVCGNPAFAEDASANISQRAREASSNFADCVMKKHAPIARAAVLNNLKSEDLKIKAKLLMDRWCMVSAGSGINQYLSWPGDAFLFALATAVVRKDYGNRAIFDFTGRARLLHRQYTATDHLTAGWNWYEAGKKSSGDLVGSFRRAMNPAEVQEVQGDLTLSELGECVTRKAPTEAQALILSAAGSSNERKLAEKLAPVANSCLKSGQPIPSLVDFRGTLAVNFYRLAGAPHGAEVAVLETVH